MFTFDGWVTRVTFGLHWALETRLHASALNSELTITSSIVFPVNECMTIGVHRLRRNVNTMTITSSIVIPQVQCTMTITSSIVFQTSNVL